MAALDLDRKVSFQRSRNMGPNPFQAFISVMRGCDQACTFCVVPRTRGKEVSRPVLEIVEEARRLVDAGVREITLLGQTVNSYGKRLAKQRKIGLHHVLHELNKIRGLERISFITSHPRFMFPELIEAMADLEKVTKYLHLPVQSGSDSVLGRMLRTYTIDEYRRVVDAIRERIPDIGLATDIIVGFCGESDDEFEATVRLLDEMRYQGAFVFKYSERKGTRAASIYADDVPEEVKKERNQRTLKIVERHARTIYAERIGRLEEVLVEGASKLDRTRLTGRNRRHQIVVFPGEVDEGLVGQLVPVRVTEATNVVLVGEKVGPGR